MAGQLGLLLLLLFLARPSTNAEACTTLVGGRATTRNGSIVAAHSNDGDGDTAGNLARVHAADWPANATRPVSKGTIPQSRHTWGYFTKPGGYASLNEHQVGLAESTCNAVLAGDASKGAVLNIVDLSALGLERSTSSRQAIEVMGSLAETYGYYDNGESLFVVDPLEAYVFHVLPDDSGGSAVWAAQRIPDNHVGVVANAFTIRTIDFGNPEAFLYSNNIRTVATRCGLWNGTSPFDFTRIFSGPELGHKYASGRRMWVAYKLLAPNVVMPSTYGDLVQDAPYPATVQVVNHTLSLSDFIHVMRNSYQDTPYDMTQPSTGRMAAGAWGTPDRWAPGAGEAVVHGSWERTIATVKTIVSYVLQLRHWLPNPVGGVLWFAPHAAHTSCYVPFPCGMVSDMVASFPLPVAYTNNTIMNVDRGVGAWQASRFVFNIAQLKFSFMISDINALQQRMENASLKLQASVDAEYVKAPGSKSMLSVAVAYSNNANAVVKAWWGLADYLMLRYADGYCNGCQKDEPRHMGYPAWWLNDVGYADGPAAAAV